MQNLHAGLGAYFAIRPGCKIRIQARQQKTHAGQQENFASWQPACKICISTACKICISRECKICT